MNKKYHSLIQGSDDWHQFRAVHFTASEAPAMLGLSKFQSRDGLLKMKKTGAPPKINPATQKRFDLGHKYESMARPFAEEIIGEELFSPTISIEIDGLPLSASLDGEPMNGDIWEHKTLNSALAENIPNGLIDPMYTAQMEQQLMVSGADRCLFMASTGTKESMTYCWYESDYELREKIIAGWKQFDKDLEAYEVKAVVEKTVAQSIETLPALSISISSEVLTSNLQAYEDAAMSLISNINTDLQSDQDFTDAKAMVKFCDNAETELKAAKERALSENVDISALFATLDKVGESIRQTRLNLNKQVTTQTASKKKSLIDAATNEVYAHFNKVSDDLGISIPAISPDYEGAIKRKSNFDLMEGSLNDLVASSKILINETADRFRANLKLMNDAGAANLFQDIRSVVDTSPEHFTLLVESRVNAEKQRLEAEKKRILDEEAERVRKVEADRVAEEQRKTEADRLQEIAKERRIEEDRNAAALRAATVGLDMTPAAKDATPAAQSYNEPAATSAEVVSIAPAEKKELQFKVVDLNGLPERFVNIDIIGIRAELEAGNSVTGVEVMG